jgi:hypothetical protein
VLRLDWWDEDLLAGRVGNVTDLLLPVESDTLPPTFTDGSRCNLMEACLRDYRIPGLKAGSQGLQGAQGLQAGGCGSQQIGVRGGDEL